MKKLIYFLSGCLTTIIIISSATVYAKSAEISDKEASNDPLSSVTYNDDAIADRELEGLANSDTIPEIQKTDSLSFSERIKYSSPRYILAKNMSGSMQNLIMAGDTVIIDKKAYETNKPNRFDVVAFKFAPNQIYIKRIIGLPGDTLEIKNGAVYINGNEKPLNEPFATNKLQENFGPYEIPKDSYFVMGDNRDNSYDSRFWENAYRLEGDVLGQLILISK